MGGCCCGTVLKTTAVSRRHGATLAARRTPAISLGDGWRDVGDGAFIAGGIPRAMRHTRVTRTAARTLHPARAKVASNRKPSSGAVSSRARAPRDESVVPGAVEEDRAGAPWWRDPETGGLSGVARRSLVAAAAQLAFAAAALQGQRLYDVWRQAGWGREGWSGAAAGPPMSFQDQWQAEARGWRDRGAR